MRHSLLLVLSLSLGLAGAARAADGQTCIRHTKAGSWPVTDGIEGNPWVFARVNGRWHAATYEWLRPGQECKLITPGNIGAHTKKAPLKTWTPAYGELVGFMVSTFARDDTQSSNERSNVVLERWGLKMPGPDSGEDQLDLSEVTWLHHNVSGWDRTSRIKDVEFKGSSAHPNASALAGR